MKILTSLSSVLIGAFITSCGNKFTDSYEPIDDVSTRGVVSHKDPVALKEVSNEKELREMRKKMESRGYREIGRSSWTGPLTSGFTAKQAANHARIIGANAVIKMEPIFVGFGEAKEWIDNPREIPMLVDEFSDDITTTTTKHDWDTTEIPVTYRKMQHHTYFLYSADTVEPFKGRLKKY